jgi:alginate O-acetyltransferase complex protein AlgI
MILISFALFDGSSATAVFADLQTMAGFSSLPFASLETWYYLRSYAVVLLLAAIGATPVPRMLWQRSLASPGLARIVHTLEPLYLILLLLSATAFLVDGSFNPFLYFRF